MQRKKINFSRLISSAHSELPFSVLFCTISIILSMSNSLCSISLSKVTLNSFSFSFYFSCSAYVVSAIFPCLRGDLYAWNIEEGICYFEFFMGVFYIKGSLYSRMIISRGTYLVSVLKTLVSIFSVQEFLQYLKCSYTNHSAWKMTTVHPNVPSFWCLWSVISIKLLHFTFFFVFWCFGAKRSAFKLYGGHWFPELLAVLKLFWNVFDLRRKLDKGYFFILGPKMLLNSKFLQKFSP